MSEETIEASNPTLGSFKVSSANLNSLFTVLCFALLCLIGWVLYAHAGDTKENGGAVAKELKEANKEVAAALKDSNKEVSKVLSELAQAMRERNCLDSFQQEKRLENAERCRQISR